MNITQQKVKIQLNLSPCVTPCQREGNLSLFSKVWYISEYYKGVHEFTDIAIVGSKEGEVNEQITSPCGVCRQALFEFGGKDLNVIMAKSEDDFIEADLNTLLPYGFGPSNVEGNSALD